MRKIRILAVIMLCLLLLPICFGCVESVSVTQYLDGSGAVHRTILLRYDPLGADAEQLKAEIREVMERYVETNRLSDYATISEETEGEISLALLFPSIEDYYLWLGYTGREANEVEIPAKKGIVDAYDRTIDSYVTEDNIEMIRALTDESYRDFPTDVAYYYTYGTTNRSTISNGERSEKDGIYYHTWRIDPNKPTEMKIRIYGLNVMAIYLIAISIFILSLATIFVIIYITKRKDKARAVLPHNSPRLSESVFPNEYKGPEE